MTLQDIKNSVVKFARDEDGLTVVEYAVAGGLISLAVVLAFEALGVTVCGIISDIDVALGGGGATC